MARAVWRDPSVIGSMFNVNGKPFSIVGVSPPGFFGDTLRSNLPDFFLPLTQNRWSRAMPISRVRHALAGTDRASPARRHAGDRRGSDARRADPVAALALGRDERQRAGAVARADVVPEPRGSGITSMRQQYEQWLMILMAVTGFVLLIVCANIANLMLVRGMERRRQISLSMALGARVSRLVRHRSSKASCSPSPVEPPALRSRLQLRA